ncbi:hypothetical protein E1I69_13060 [Bacillus timonensis]|uniref:DUF4386 domain-containing protein n=1 Tax=Bacillus timonensis TaxID=1033734 RepID=A0A4S3PRP9_9BACI|nr:hypothetical protein [Bacillus timonensis]THE11936.1 hypothetical protein E1I69_13060 [Bacillus timonensis]
MVRQRLGAYCAFISALMLVLVMVISQTVVVEGKDVYEQTVHSLATYPVLNWVLLLSGAFAMILVFWTVEAIDTRLRSGYPELSSNVSRFAYLHLLSYTFYMLLPAAALHDLVNKDQNIQEAITTIHPMIELGLVISVFSSICLSIWLIQVGYLILKTGLFSKSLGVFTIIISLIVLFSGAYEALYGRGSVIGIISSILTFVGAFVIWKIWVGVELLRR